MGKKNKQEKKTCKITKVKIDRTNETRMMNCGYMATIIAMRRCEDMVVQFEDGTIVEHVRSCHWLRGKVSNPNLKCANATSLQEFAIEYYLRNYGFEKIEKGSGKELGLENFELDFYHKEKKVAIECDGQIHDLPECVEREYRKNQLCAAINELTLYRLRSPRLKHVCDNSSINYILDPKKEIRPDFIDCKEELEEILRKHNIPFNENDIDFVRDQDKILKKYINADAKERVGRRVFHKKTNQYMTSIDYINSKNVIVQFDDGTIVTGIDYQMFEKGYVKYPTEQDELNQKRKSA